MLVEDLLHYSPLRLISAGPKTSISEAVQRMAKYNIGLVVVMDDNDNVAGVFSERDLVKGFVDTETAIEEAVVGDFMTESVISVSPTDSLPDAVLAMNTHGIRHLIVMQAGKPVGVLSIRDVLRVFANQLLEVDCKTEGELDTAFVRALAAI
jgi:signal-transduction protein with cAMP-binding, CBS, and nucleotidyltransferase domain